VDRLIERDALLAKLRPEVDEATARRGRVFLVSGEAGAGKTSVVESLVSGLHATPARQILWGRCDDLHTARAFGPVADIAGSDPTLRALLGQGAAAPAIAARLLELMARPSVVIIEDLHWADEATLDLVGFIGRRIDHTSAALVLTYRSDEVARNHPAAVVIGELATTRPIRIAVPPLSVAGIAVLGGAGCDADSLFERTGGNPFFVTECLATDALVPDSVHDAVLARAERLTPAARTVYDLVAVVPGSAELWLLEAMGADPDGLDECIARGVLVLDAERVRFRHELARSAALDDVPPMRRRAVNGRATSALSHPPTGAVDHARVVHHAQEAGDVGAVLHHGPLAAADALRAGARVQAAAHLELVLSHAAIIDAATQCDLWEEFGQVLSDLGRDDEAAAAYRRAIELASDLGDLVHQGGLLAQSAPPLAALGRVEESDAAVTASIDLLEPLGPTPSLARALVQRCGGLMLARELTEAEPWGERAIALSEELGLSDELALAHIQTGVAGWMGGNEDGLAWIERGIALAERAGRPNLVVFGLSQIGSGGGEIRRYGEATAALERCIDLADRHQLAGSGLYAKAWLGRCCLEQGRWDQAGIILGQVLRSPRCTGITRMTALTAVGRLRARRGDPDVWAVLDEALQLARSTGHLQRLWPVAAARIEARWLADDDADADADLVREVHEVAASLDYPWAQEELGFWLWRFGRFQPVEGVTPFGLHASGRYEDAASSWDALGCRYEAAGARAEGDGSASLLSAFRVLDDLGAAPARSRVVRRMRELGVVVPRGPNAATKGNAAGLTDRELEVLRLVAQGLSNREIATALTISTKTVGHHVSHLLVKLDVPSRAAAVAAASRAGVALEA